jgi:hypothetical protein
LKHVIFYLARVQVSLVWNSRDERSKNSEKLSLLQEVSFPTEVSTQIAACQLSYFLGSILTKHLTSLLSSSVINLGDCTRGSSYGQMADQEVTCM